VAVEATCGHDVFEEKQSEWILWELKQQGKRTLAAKVVLHGWLRQNLLQKNCFSVKSCISLQTVEAASDVSGNESKDFIGPHGDDIGHSKTALCGRAERKTNLSHGELLVEEAVVAAGLNVVRLVDLQARGGRATRQRWPALMRILSQANCVTSAFKDTLYRSPRSVRDHLPPKFKLSAKSRSV
jgi:hypothetical protein